MRVLVLLLVLLVGCAAPTESTDSQATSPLFHGVETSQTTGAILGVVVDETITPIRNATVVLLSDGSKTRTDHVGAFGFSDVEPGFHFVKVDKQGFNATQTSIEVTAGQKTPVARIQLISAPGELPYIEAHQFTIGITASISFSQPDHPYFYGFLNSRNIPHIDINSGAQVTQGEFIWTGSTSLAKYGRPSSHAWGDEGSVDDQVKQGESPQVLRLNMTGDVSPATDVDFDFWASAGGGVPVGVMYDQKIQIIAHVFYRMTPDPDWVFGEHGEHPIPRE